MKVVILAGGFGTRISEESRSRPKPMIEVGGKPILWHIMDNYARQGFNDFIVALGYKADVIKEYFFNYHGRNSDFSVDLSNNTLTYLNKSKVDWKVTLVDTGLNSMTGGRLFNLKNLLSHEDNFLLTYGDGLSDVRINDVIKLHNDNNAIATLTAVRPTARFGNLTMEGCKVLEFKEKPQTEVGRINGGFFVFNKEVFNFLDSPSNVLEREPLEMIARDKRLYAYEHDGFWQCMDTLRDKMYLESIYTENNSPWIVD